MHCSSVRFLRRVALGHRYIHERVIEILFDRASAKVLNATHCNRHEHIAIYTLLEAVFVCFTYRLGVGSLVGPGVLFFLLTFRLPSRSRFGCLGGLSSDYGPAAMHCVIGFLCRVLWWGSFGCRRWRSGVWLACCVFACSGFCRFRAPRRATWIRSSTVLHSHWVLAALCLFRWCIPVFVHLTWWVFTRRVQVRAFLGSGPLHCCIAFPSCCCFLQYWFGPPLSGSST